MAGASASASIDAANSMANVPPMEDPTITTSSQPASSIAARAAATPKARVQGLGAPSRMTARACLGVGRWVQPKPGRSTATAAMPRASRRRSTRRQVATLP